MLAKLVTSFNGKRIRKMRRYVNPGQKTYFDKLVINEVVSNFDIKDTDYLVLRYRWYISIRSLDQTEIL
jgi:hypothetical protein